MLNSENILLSFSGNYLKKRAFVLFELSGKNVLTITYSESGDAAKDSDISV